MSREGAKRADQFVDRVFGIVFWPFELARGRGVVARVFAVAFGGIAVLLLAFLTFPLFFAGVMWHMFESLEEP